MRPMLALVLAVVCAAPAAAIQGEPIQDNSFLLQEAYNQPAGVVQHIVTAEPDANGETRFTFAQEWPLAGVRHQLGFGIPVFCPCGEPGRDVGLGDVELSYRYQAAGAGGGRLHVAPELALSLPTGSARFGRGLDAPGFGVTVPLSVTIAPSFVAHANAGLSLVPGLEDAQGARVTSTGWLAGGSLVWLARPAVNLLVEGIWESEEVPAAAGSTRRSAFTIAPGARVAFPLGSAQVVPGVAVPVTHEDGTSDAGWLLYLSVEHRFTGERR